MSKVGLYRLGSSRLPAVIIARSGKALVFPNKLAPHSGAITHKKRIGGTFVAHRTAKAASRKLSSHSFYSLLARQLLAPLLPPIAPEIDGIGAGPEG